MKDNTYLAGTILVAALIIAGSIIYAFAPTRPQISLNNNNAATYNLPPLKADLPYEQTMGEGGDVVLGDTNSLVKIVEYGDYQCPFCEKFFKESESRIREQYIGSGKANMIYKDLIVIDGFVAGGHESADSALAANCAADQNKFWEYHDALFTVEGLDGKENNGNLTKELFLKIADSLGLNKTVFEICYDSRKYDAEVTADTEEASKDLERLSTPSTLINGELVAGAVPFAEFAKVVDKYIK